MSLSFSERFRPPNLDNPYYSYMNKCFRSCHRNYTFRDTDSYANRYIEKRRVYCNLWACLCCGPIKAELLRERIIAESENHRLHNHLTLTQDSERDTPNSFKTIKKSWKTYRQYLHRHYDKAFNYIWILGVDESDQPHLHVLTNIKIPRSTISREWSKRGGGQIVHCEDVWRINGLADYLACNLLASGYPRNERHYGCSSGIDLKINKIESKWRVAPDIVSLDELSLQHRVYSRKFNHQGKLVYCRVRMSPDFTDKT